jgi:hypothetical protein
MDVASAVDGFPLRSSRKVTMARYKVEFEAETHANQESYAPEFLKLVYVVNGQHVAVVVPKAWATKLRPEPTPGELWMTQSGQIGFVMTDHDDSLMIQYGHGGWDFPHVATNRIYPPE